jgi:hypothetical protein
VPAGDEFKSFQIGRDVPQQIIIFSDGPIFGNGDYD